MRKWIVCLVILSCIFLSFGDGNVYNNPTVEGNWGNILNIQYYSGKIYVITDLDIDGNGGSGFYLDDDEKNNRLLSLLFSAHANNMRVCVERIYWVDSFGAGNANTDLVSENQPRIRFKNN